MTVERLRQVLAMSCLRQVLAMSCLLLALYECAQAETCDRKDRCSECLRASAECGWCADTNDNRKSISAVSRCRLLSTFADVDCKNLYPTLPITTLTLKKDGNFSTFNQIRPQEVELQLRIGQTETFNVSVLRAPNYPVDLYYLMDVSSSMKDDLTQLKRLATDLTKTIDSLTNKFRVGFGKFVDKETLPFVDTYGPRLEDPCGDGCEPAFAFINSLPLNSNETVFVTGIKSEATSGNLDFPEGLLDALMQTAVCVDAINWTQNAWHLVVVATDAPFHTAGEGKLAGIFAPNDGLCHLDSSGAGGRYTHATEQDYPSVSHIRRVLHDNRISPIFAVTADWEYLYKNLTKALIPVTSFVGRLASDSSNIPSLIRNGYEGIASQVFLTAVTAGSNVKTEVKVISCGYNDTDAEVDSSGQGCRGVAEGEMALFSVSIELTECRSEPFNLSLNAGAYGQTMVMVVPICNCTCEEQLVYNASECNGHGKLECGACICNSLWTGTQCQCSLGNLADSACKPVDASKDEPDCSGHGQCVCDICECDVSNTGRPLWSGEYCQCPQLSCPVNLTGVECGGPERGECICDSSCNCDCQCKGGWRNDEDNPACDCVPVSKSTCSDTGEVCSNHGNCSCDGQCECTDDRYFGIYCESCIDCPNVCTDDNVTECVACAKSGRKCNINCPFNITVLSSKQEGNYEIKYQGKPQKTEKCAITDEDRCIHIFYITENKLDGVRQVDALSSNLRDCPSSIDIVPLIIGIMAGIFGVGMFILFTWWALIQFAAYREYKAFLKEQAQASWNQTTSPLYEPPSQKYLNPMYGGKEAKAES